MSEVSRRDVDDVRCDLERKIEDQAQTIRELRDRLRTEETTSHDLHCRCNELERRLEKLEVTQK
jgi:hypothetical protein